jgi:hypothetical protein
MQPLRARCVCIEDPKVSLTKSAVEQKWLTEITQGMKMLT